MLHWKYSECRLFIINEYWIFIPPAILANILAIRYIRGRKKKIRELKKLRGQIEDSQKMRRVVSLATCLNGVSRLSHILFRGGENFIDVKCINSEIQEGLSYLDNDRLRKIIHFLYSHKREGKMIYITATALCQVALRYGPMFLSLPVAIGDFGITSLAQFIRKFVVVLLIGSVLPLFTLGGSPAIVAGILAWVAGAKLAFTDMEFIATTLITATVNGDKLKPRIPDLNDVVVINNRNKITMTNPVQERPECWLADQALLNSNCKIKPTEIPDAINLVIPTPKYDDVVNMQDVTGLSYVEFSDRLDLGLDLKQAKPSDIPDFTPPQRPKGKLVNFLDKFGDPDFVEEKCKWDVSEPIVPETAYLRARNQDKP